MDDEIQELHLGDSIALQYDTYESYLDSQITPVDLYYLEDEDLARQLVELGYRGSGETLKREEFESRKRAAENARLSKQRNAGKIRLASAGLDLSNFPFLQALSDREEMVRSGKLTTIIFIRDFNRKGQEVSGYIDYAHRLKSENFEPYFERRKRLMPRPSGTCRNAAATAAATQRLISPPPLAPPAALPLRAFPLLARHRVQLRPVLVPLPPQTSPSSTGRRRRRRRTARQISRSSPTTRPAFSSRTSATARSSTSTPRPTRATTRFALKSRRTSTSRSACTTT